MANEVEIIVTSRDRTGPGFRSAKTEAKGFSGVVSGVGRSLKTVFGAAIVAQGARKIVGFFNDSKDSAVNLRESVNAVNKVFKGSADEILRWGEQNANSLGLTRAEFNQSGTIIGAMLKNTGMEMSGVVDWTKRITERSADMASVYNKDVTQAHEAFNALLRGETEQMEQFGVSIKQSDINQRALAETGKKSEKQLTKQEKATAALNLAFEQTNDTAGDFRDTSDDLANKQRIVSAKVEDTKAKIGELLLPAYDAVYTKLLDDVIPTVNDFVDALDDSGGASDNAKGRYGAYLKKLEAGGQVSDDAKTDAEHVAEGLKDVLGAINRVVNNPWVERWNERLDTWLNDTDDYKEKWSNRFRSWWGREAPAQHRYRKEWRVGWFDSAGQWIRDTDDWKEKWSSRFRSWFGREKTRQSSYRREWRTGWLNGLVQWLRDTDDYKERWQRRWENARSWLTRQWRRISSSFVGEAVLGLFNWVSRTGEWIARWKKRWTNLVSWFRNIPDRIARAAGNIAGRIKAKFKDVLKGFSIPIKLAFGLGGDGLGIGALPGGGGGLMGAGGAVAAAYSALGRPGNVISGFRPGSRTRSGNLSYHALRRALDISPIRSIAVAINRIFGSRTKELITPWRDLNLHNGRPHSYSAGVMADHSGSRAHIHWAMRHGGIAPGGWTLLGEEGPELARIPAGTQVATAGQTTRWMNDGYGIPGSGMGMGGGNVTVNLYVQGSIRSDRELVEIIRNEFNHGGFRGVVRT